MEIFVGIIVMILVTVVFLIIMGGIIFSFLYIVLDESNSLKLKVSSYFSGLPPVNCEKCGKPIPARKKKCSRCTSDETWDAVGGIFVGAVGILIAGTILKAGFSFLKGIDLQSLNPTIKKAIELASNDLKNISSGNRRLERAEKLLSENDKISVDQAAMLTCATLENGLKILANQNRIEENLGEKEGMVDLAIRLENNNIISYDDLRGIKTLAYKIRNPVMHGDFERFDSGDVREQINFTRDFFSKYNII